MNKNTEKPVENLQDLLARPNEIQLSLFKNYLELVSLFARELFNTEVEGKAGKKYKRANREILADPKRIWSAFGAHLKRELPLLRTKI